MLASTDFTVQMIQAVVFVSREELNPSLILRYALDHWSEIYDAQPISLPVPPDIPLDIPVVVLSSRDESLRLEVSRRRINMIWNRRSQAIIGLNEVLGDFARRLGEISASQELTIGRLGAVVSRVAEAPRPGLVLAQQFCKQELLNAPLNRPEGFELHAHKVFQLIDDVYVNSWIRIKTAKGGGVDYNQVVTEQDINTLGEELDAREFSPESLVTWFTAAGREFGGILERYFPSAQE